MRYIILSFFLFSGVVVMAQQDTTTIYSRSGFEKDPIRSSFKKIIVQKDSLWLVTLVDRKGVLQEKITFTDEKLEVRKGPYELYESGKLKEKGYYNRGYKVGEWTTYYPNQQVFLKATYIWGKLHGSLKRYWDNGQLKEEANYGNNLKLGDRTMFYKTGKIALKEFYDADKKVAGTYFDRDGNITPDLQVIGPPSFPGGMQAFDQFLAQEIRYPPSALKNRIMGTVNLSFLVKKDGSITDIKLVGNADPDLVREAIRALSRSQKWISASELGEPLEMRYTVPVKFSAQ